MKRIQKKNYYVKNYIFRYPHKNAITINSNSNVFAYFDIIYGTKLFYIISIKNV